MLDHQAQEQPEVIDRDPAKRVKLKELNVQTQPASK
jgi:hypothetical protein